MQKQFLKAVSLTLMKQVKSKTCKKGVGDMKKGG